MEGQFQTGNFKGIKGKNKSLFLKCDSPLANNKFYSALYCKTLEIIYTYTYLPEVLHETGKT